MTKHLAKIGLGLLLLAGLFAAGTWRKRDATVDHGGPDSAAAVRATPNVPDADAETTEEELRALEALANEGRVLAPAPRELPEIEERIAAVQSQAAGEARRKSWRDFAVELAARDPATGRRIAERLMTVKTNLGISDATVFLAAFQEAYAARDPSGAALWAASLPAEHRSSALGVAARQWASKDPEGALNWLGRTGDEASRLALLRTMGLVVEQSGEASRIRAWAAQVAMMPEGPKLGDLVGRMWSRVNAEEAVRWAGGLKGIEEQKAAVSGVVEGVADLNPERAGEWVKRFPSGAVRNQAIKEAASVWAGKDPARAAVWVDSVADARLQEELHPMIAREWRAQDPQGMKAWATGARLSAPMRAYYLGR